ncbi:hypothetical protein RUND412_005202 [Rhizina undulata]
MCTASPSAAATSSRQHRPPTILKINKPKLLSPSSSNSSSTMPDAFVAGSAASVVSAAGHDCYLPSPSEMPLLEQKRLAEIAAAEAERQRAGAEAAAEAKKKRPAEIEAAEAEHQRVEAGIAAAKAEKKRLVGITAAEAEVTERRCLALAAAEAEAERLRLAKLEEEAVEEQESQRLEEEAIQRKAAEQAAIQLQEEENLGWEEHDRQRRLAEDECIRLMDLKFTEEKRSMAAEQKRMDTMYRELEEQRIALEGKGEDEERRRRDEEGLDGLESRLSEPSDEPSSALTPVKESSSSSQSNHSVSLANAVSRDLPGDNRANAKLLNPTFVIYPDIPRLDEAILGDTISARRPNKRPADVLDMEPLFTKRVCTQNKDLTQPPPPLPATFPHPRTSRLHNKYALGTVTVLTSNLVSQPGDTSRRKRELTTLIKPTEFWPTRPPPDVAWTFLWEDEYGIISRCCTWADVSLRNWLDADIAAETKMVKDDDDVEFSSDFEQDDNAGDSGDSSEEDSESEDTGSDGEWDSNEEDDEEFGGF